ncbi:hypothetical protein FRX31_027254, partial [Thalictrum thalictroides]
MPSSTPSNVKKCAHCKRKGHLRESCFLWLDTPDGSKWAAKNPEKAAKTRALQKKLNKRANKNGRASFSKRNNSNNENNSSQSGAWVVEENALVSYTARKSNDIVLDTGATNHIFHDKSMFTSIVPCKKSIVTASGDTIPVSGMGNVSFKVFNYVNGNSKTIQMENVWHVPSCTKNLVSGIQLLSKGYGISSSDENLSVLSSCGEIIATARPRLGLFCFNTSLSSYPVAQHIPPSISSDVFISESVQKSSTKLIHNRLGHVGLQLISKINVSSFELPKLKSKVLNDFHIDKAILNSCNV